MSQLSVEIFFSRSTIVNMADMEDVMRGIFVLPNEVGLVVLTLSKHRLTMSM